MQGRLFSVCPRCGRYSLERRIGAGAGILFKGSGFYQTDYRSESYTKAQKAESGASVEGSKNAEAKKSTKPKSAAPKGDAA